MLNSIVKWSIAQRWLVVLVSILLSLWGLRVITQMPLDVFPAFAPPQVEIQTEAAGLAPEEVESLVTRPIESAINGTPGLVSLRSASAVGISSVKAVFSWNTDIYRARQLVTERLGRTQSILPQGVDQPEILPVSSPTWLDSQICLYLGFNATHGGFKASWMGHQKPIVSGSRRKQCIPVWRRRSTVSSPR